MKVGKTIRGFEVITFEDTYKVSCSLQESSCVSPRVWLGTDASDRMHLSPSQVKKIIKHLQAWLDTGSFVVKKHNTK